MAAYVPAPELVQFADEELLIALGSVVNPGFIERNPGGNGLRLRVEGDFKDPALRTKAGDEFQVLLGALRAWRPIAGQRKDELSHSGVGSGSIRDDQGNQAVGVASVISYAIVDHEFTTFANQVKVACDAGPFIRNALWLNGRRDRNAADFYMIYEYAEEDLGGAKAVAAALGVSNRDITRLTRSANNLAPADGGRHVRMSGTAEWTLAEQREFITRFLQRWITYRARS
jgi:hypothetical protein